MRKLFIAYLIAAHLLLGYLTIRAVQRRLIHQPTKQEQYISVSRDMLRGMDQNKPPNSIVFLGDSLTESFAVSVNYGIGFSTTKDINDRINDYDWSDVKTLVFMIGTNDALLGKEPERLNLPNVPIIWYATPPLNDGNEKIKQNNEYFREQCAALPNCRFIELPLDGPQYRLPDGVHLNREGYAIWRDSLNHLLK